MAETTVNIEPGLAAGVITDLSRENFDLAAGDRVTVVIKSTEAMIGMD